MRFGNGGCLPGGASKFIETRTLRISVQKSLRFVLAMKIHERSSDFSENARRDWGAVRPRASPPRHGNFALEDDRSLVSVDATLIHERNKRRVRRNVEDSLYGRLVRTSANEIGASPLAKQKTKSTDNYGFPGARLTGQDVEAAR
jgi:hypothetical protein